MDGSGWGSANGNPLIQWNCLPGQANQQWQFARTDSGYYTVSARYAPLLWDVPSGATNDQVPMQLWSYVGGLNQQWFPIALADGSFNFAPRNSGSCLDVPGASTTPARLQQYTCNGTGAQAFTLTQVQ